MLYVTDWRKNTKINVVVDAKGGRTRAVYIELLMKTDSV